MNATKRRDGSRPGLADAANVLTTAIRADGRHDHVTVRAERGFLTTIAGGVICCMLSFGSLPCGARSLLMSPPPPPPPAS